MSRPASWRHWALAAALIIDGCLKDSSPGSDPVSLPPAYTQVEIGKEIAAALKSEGEVLRYTVESPPRGMLKLSVTGIPEPVDLVVTYRDSTGTILTANPPCCGVRGFEAWIIAGPGPVRFDFSDHGYDYSATSFVFRFDLDLSDTTENNNNVPSARRLRLGDTVEARLFPKEDLEFFQLDSAPEGLLTVRALGVPEQVTIGLKGDYDPDRRVSSARPDFAKYGYDGPAYWTANILAGPCRFHLKYGEYSGIMEKPFRMTVERNRFDTWEGNDTPDESVPVLFGAVYHASIHPESDKDWYKFTLTAGDTARVRIRADSLWRNNVSWAVTQGTTTQGLPMTHDKDDTIVVPGPGNFYLYVAAFLGSIVWETNTYTFSVEK